MSTKPVPQAILKPFLLVPMPLLVLGFILGVFDDRLTMFLGLSAFLIALDGSAFHRNNLKEYWKEVIATKGRGGLYDREWNSWSMKRRLFHMLMFVVVAAVMVFGSFYVYSQTWPNLWQWLGYIAVLVVLPFVIWIWATERTLPKRTVEPTRQD